MRQIALDTETTGLEIHKNHRVIEIGCVEFVNGRRTGEVYHCYINPERSIAAEAVKVHGLSEDFLRDKLRFKNIADDFLEFIADGELIIHNAQFDLGFLNAELARMKKPNLKNSIIDTLLIARKKFPNQANNLNALCQRFSIDLSKRSKHGALLDAGLLAEVYIALSAGNQTSLILDNEEGGLKTELEEETSITVETSLKISNAPKTPTKLAPRLIEDEITAHQILLQKLKKPLWAEFLGINK